ncbi:heparinase II/III family protein [Defluviimonas sp. WL0002]|uniref:Heparinase II/III family protein n=1 Tax=Albidovulum marisflavi TaxID=2984159 RepID=A0ABT2Z919_9RHOB|nr:heparinase II/III family protein [Defluviimonas sp. WL0002]MCV2867596.1 heparinase II/III family protein [Defluviimonas sp. WL0002]
MRQSDIGQVARTRWADRLHARIAALAGAPEGFVRPPEPRTIGSFAKGRQLVSGNFQLAGFLVEDLDRSIWDIRMPDRRFEAELHGCTWLDDLAAVADGAARARAQAWVFEWIARFGSGRGPGWAPDLTGRRLIRLINHAPFLLGGRDKADTAALFRCLGLQTVYLSRRWRAASDGMPRIEALTGLISAAQALRGMARYLPQASAALARLCERHIDTDGAIASRNPQELMEILTHLNWAEAALREAGRVPPPALRTAIERIAPTLRALRHADGGLARFHGGGRGPEGRLDQALAAAGVRAVTAHGLAMGYARLAAGRTTVIVDAAAPPKGPASVNAHASTLAMELTSARRPLVVNCGSGASFGADWWRAGRATPLHSTLCIRGHSSSRVDPQTGVGGTGRGVLAEVPDQVWAQIDSDLDGLRLLAGHNGFAPTHGMTHVRELNLSIDGRHLSGEDTLGAMSGPDRKRFEKVIRRLGPDGIRFDLRFHLHPDVDAALDLGGTAVSLALKSGEIWVFRHDGVGDVALEPSVYLERGRLRPRPARQIVLSATVLDYACQLGWTLAKAQDTPAAIRDIRRDDDAPKHS